jgi:hypothetical protein
LKTRSKAWGAFAATVGACALVLVTALPAQAATIQFHDGLTFQNQTVFSSSASKTGATSTEFAQIASSYIATIGFGETSGASSATITHARVSAQSYCRWRLIFPDNDPGNLRIVCKYFS